MRPRGLAGQPVATWSMEPRPGFLRVLVFVARAAIAPVVALVWLHPWTALKTRSNAVLVASATVFRGEETPFSTHKQV